MQIIKKKGKIVGVVLMIISLAFIGREIVRLDIRAIEFEDPLKAFIYIFLFSVIFISSVAAGGFGWNLILSFLHGKPIAYRDVFPIYVKANVAKYMPGNVMHYASRNLLGVKLGLKHGEILLSSFFEVALVFLSAALFSAIFAHRTFMDIVESAFYAMGEKAYLKWIALCGIVLIIALIIYAIKKKPEYREKFKILLSLDFLKLFLKTFLVYSFTFVVMGLMLVGIFGGIFNMDMTPSSILTIISASVLSWFAGFITPGAPGGLGVKESVLILMLSPMYGREYTLIAALIHRLISIFGDLLAFGVGTLVDRNSKREMNKGI